MNDELSRMVLNPDVTVRSRGVIEKCSFCVQRLQEGKLKAKKENRTLTDGDAKTACQQACAADAIIFGNVNNNDSQISTVRRENFGRLFYSLEQLHVLPNVNYLAKVRNTDIAYGLPKEEEEEAPEAEQMELLPSFSDIQLDAEISRTSDDEEEDWLPQPAPFLQRFVAGLVDAALVCIATGVFVATFLKLAEDVPQSRITTFCELAMGGVLWLLFQYVFLVYARTTPGMRIAQLELAAFEGKTTSLFARRYRALVQPVQCCHSGRCQSHSGADPDGRLRILRRLFAGRMLGPRDLDQGGL